MSPHPHDSATARKMEKSASDCPGARETFLISPGAWAIGSGGYFCDGLSMTLAGQAFQPFEEQFPAAVIALDQLGPYTAEMFDTDDSDRAAAENGFGVLPSALEPGWQNTVSQVISEATLTQPADTPFVSSGKSGLHSEHMGHLLGELQYMQRTFPGAQW